VETVYHRAVRSETGQPPIERWLGSIPRPLPLPSTADLREAFLWSEFRTVTKTATVSLHGKLLRGRPVPGRDEDRAGLRPVRPDRHGLHDAVRGVADRAAHTAEADEHGVLAALDQRISISFQLPTMSKGETASYIKHHLTIAGRSDPLFSDDAVDLIHLTSRGLPRSVNNIALQSLIAAFADEKSIVDESSTRLVITETHATD
jgi:hypothetical protein